MTKGGIDRRRALALLAAAPMATAFVGSKEEVAAAQRAVEGGTSPSFFTDHEYETVRLLADLLIPRDERSGSASDARVPEFIDFMMMDQPARQVVMRGGLAWLDFECQRRFDRTFVEASDEDRTALLNDIAWPAKAPPELAHGAEFLSRFRDLTATGFFTSKMGMADLRYMGNELVTEWTGCPPEALRKLGLAD